MNVKEIEAPELADWLDESETPVRVIDVRQMNEIAAGTIPGAEPMPLHTLPARIQDLREQEPMVLVCRSGARSAQACQFLQQYGFENVYNLRGGVIAWSRSGQPFGLPEAV